MSGVLWWLAVPVVLAALLVAGYGALALHVWLTRPAAEAIAAARERRPVLEEVSR